MQQYGRFPSDVDTREVAIQELYPGCGCVVKTIILREELPDYTKQPDDTYIGLDPSGECARHLEMEGLRQEWQAFEQRFKSGHGDWTPTREERLAHERVGRELLLVELETLPRVSPEDVAHARNYLDPARWRSSDFLARVFPILADRSRKKS